MEFRLLKADEIECRVSTVKESGVSLLLYKDARVDQNILDETVGSMFWQRKHELINGNLFCSVGIHCKELDEWIWKQDVGTESYTEKEKGQASDAFKRACFNWGIGRELYTAPFIWVKAENVNIKPGKDGKYTTFDKFEVKEIGYHDKKISKLTIYNKDLKRVVFDMGKPVKVDPKQEAARLSKINDWLTDINGECERTGLSRDSIFSSMKITDPKKLTEDEYQRIMNKFGTLPDKDA